MFSKLFFCAVTPSHHDVAQVMGGCGNARGNHGRVGRPWGSMGLSIVMGVPSGNLTWLLKMAIYSGFSH